MNLDISNLSFEELDSLANLYVSFGRISEAGKIFDFLGEELQKELELNCLENQSSEQ